MSSTDFRGLVPASNDPISQAIVLLMKKLAKNTIANQVELIDSDNEDIYSNGQDIDTVIKYHSDLSNTHRFDFLREYFPPFEPDGDILRLWVRGINTGNSTQDRSTFNHPALIHGDPTLVDGTLDLGTFTGAIKSIAMRLNRPTSDFENQEYLSIEDHADIRIGSLATGLSIFTRFRIFDFAGEGGHSKTIFEKIDDATPNNGYMLQVRSDGALLFIVKKGGTTTAKQTAAAAITAGTSCDVFLTYTVSGNVLHIYINGVDKTLTTFGGSINWQTSTTNFDLFLFQRGEGSEAGFVYGDFYDYKYYREYVVSQTEVTHHQTNKWTISDIPFGQVMITNHWATVFEGGGVPGGPSFTSISFSPLSFTV
jgi:hypothetical protein